MARLEGTASECFNLLARTVKEVVGKADILYLYRSVCI